MAKVTKITASNGTTYDIGAKYDVDGNEITKKYVKNTDELLTTNPFAGRYGSPGLYISKIDNALYAADKRFDVEYRVNGNLHDCSNLFDGSYETGVVDIGEGSSSVLTLDFSNLSGNRFPGYPYGYILVSFYHVGVPKSITGRVYNNYAAHTIGWSNLEFEQVNGAPSVYRARQSKYGLQILEITIEGQVTSGYKTRPVQVEFHLDRPSPERNPFVTKYYPETLYYPLTAPSFIGDLTGNADTATNASKVNNHTVESDVPANAKFTDTTYTPASASPKMDGTAAVGTSAKYAREDHVHPTDTSRVPTSRKVNNKALSADITLSASDVSAVPTTRKVNNKALSADITLSASDVSAIATSAKGAANGVAELDSSGKVPSSQLPSYVDDVLEYSSKSGFPATGETGKIYVDTGTNLTYRWSGSAYVEISPSLALGTTSSTAFRGDYGNSAYAHAVTNKGSAFSSGLYKITTNSEGHVTAATAVAKADITALGIPGSDTNTTYSAGTGLSLSGTKFNHSNSVTAGTAGTSSNTSGQTLAVPYITYDAQGHITATGTHTHTVSVAPSHVSRGNDATAGDLDLVTAAYIPTAASNKSFGLPANAITIEYSTNGGSSWSNYGATDAQKVSLFNESRAVNYFLGRGSSKDNNTVNNRLRITIEPLDRYCSFHGIYVWLSTNGNTVTMDLERSTIGAKDTFTTVFADQTVSGWSGNNIRYFSTGQFGGGSNQTGNYYKYRITFKQTAVNTKYQSASLNDIRFLGNNLWGVPSDSYLKNMLNNRTAYSADANGNVTFPKEITATDYNGTVNGYSIAASVPSGAKFTDTTYTASKENIGSASAGTAIPADDITSWSAGTAASASVTKGVLTITNGTAPSLGYTAKSIPNISVTSKSVVTGITAG